MQSSNQFLAVAKGKMVVKDPQLQYTDFGVQNIMERGMVARVAELSRAQEDGLRVNALWVVKNLLTNASTKEKEDIMRQIEWDYLKS